MSMLIIFSTGFTSKLLICFGIFNLNEQEGSEWIFRGAEQHAAQRVRLPLVAQEEGPAGAGAERGAREKEVKAAGEIDKLRRATDAQAEVPAPRTLQRDREARKEASVPLQGQDQLGGRTLQLDRPAHRDAGQGDFREVPRGPLPAEEEEEEVEEEQPREP